jgi:hypothetical protein
MPGAHTKLAKHLLDLLAISAAKQFLAKYLLN